MTDNPTEHLSVVSPQSVQRCKAAPVQLPLIEEKEPLSHIRLESDSPLQAWYELSIFHLPGVGYLIQKASGCRNAKPVLETWFRHDYAGAMEKYQQLLNKKMHKKSGRRYTVPQTGELQLTTDNTWHRRNA